MLQHHGHGAGALLSKRKERIDFNVFDLASWGQAAPPVGSEVERVDLNAF